MEEVEFYHNSDLEIRHLIIKEVRTIVFYFIEKKFYFEEWWNGISSYSLFLYGLAGL